MPQHNIILNEGSLPPLPPHTHSTHTHTPVGLPFPIYAQLEMTYYIICKGWWKVYLNAQGLKLIIFECTLHFPPGFSGDACILPQIPLDVFSTAWRILGQLSLLLSYKVIHCPSCTIIVPVASLLGLPPQDTGESLVCVGHTDQPCPHAHWHRQEEGLGLHAGVCMCISSTTEIVDLLFCLSSWKALAMSSNLSSMTGFWATSTSRLSTSKCIEILSCWVARLHAAHPWLYCWTFLSSLSLSSASFPPCPATTSTLQSPMWRSCARSIILSTSWRHCGPLLGMLSGEDNENWSASLQSMMKSFRCLLPL